MGVPMKKTQKRRSKKRQQNTLTSTKSMLCIRIKKVEDRGRSKKN